MKNKLMSFVAATVFAWAAGVCAQGESKGSGGCSKSENEPALSITFEKVENIKMRDGVKPTRVAYLRLRNNTSCDIKVDVLSIQRELVDKTKGTATYTTDVRLKSNAEVPLVVRLYRPDYSKPPVELSNGGSVRFPNTLPAYTSVLFAVPTEVLRCGWLVAVPFAYAWEGSAIQTSNIEHLVSFRCNEFPECLRDPLKGR